MQKTTKSKKIKVTALAIVTCVVFLAISIRSVPSSSIPKEPEEQDVSNPLVENQNSLAENLSRISELEEQLVKLNEENRQLQSVITQRSSENEKLESQVKEWSETFRTLEADLDALEKTEYIRLLVEQTRNPMMEPTENP